MRNRNPETRYQYNIRKQQQDLEDFAESEINLAEDLLYWYRIKKIDIPDEAYRGAAYFINREFTKKPGSLTMLYTLYKRLMNELPLPTKESAFDLVSYRYRRYGQSLIERGY